VEASTIENEAYLDALLSLPRLWGPAVSRNGQWVAWTWSGIGPTSDVYVAATDGWGRPVRLTDTPENTWLFSWTPDSSGVIVGQDEAGNERVQLFLVEIAHPLEMRPLTEHGPSFFIRGGQLAPGGRHLFYGANFDSESGREIEPTWIYRHDLETGERAPIARPERAARMAPSLNADGTWLLYTRSDLHPAGAQVWLVDAEGKEDREILNFGDDVKCRASWMPDGRRALVLAESETHKRLGVWDMADESLRWLIDDPGRSIESAFAPFGADRAVVLEVREARTRASLLDPEGGPERRLPQAAETLIPLAPAGDGEWVGLCYGSRQPTDLVRFGMADVPEGEMLSLSRVWQRTKLTADDFAPAHDMRWTADDSLEIQGWLYRPDGEPKGTVVCIHGGPTNHSEDAVNVQVQFFAHSGFNVLDPNYRGSTGFGLPFREAIRKDGWGGAEQDDIRAGIEALIAEGIAEPGKVGVTGTSYGGYSSWCAITRFPPEIAAASAPICGMTDLVVDYETTRPDLRPYSEEMMGGSPSQVPERYMERSPINFVGDIRGRLLIVQGARDPNVTPENVAAVTRALDEAGIAYETLVFEDEGHGISRPLNQKALCLRLLRFFEEAFRNKD
jgi:dipeptidyl aminopeptidase/acylaminoacyl peptidase